MSVNGVGLNLPQLLNTNISNGGATNANGNVFGQQQQGNAIDKMTLQQLLQLLLMLQSQQQGQSTEDQSATKSNVADSSAGGLTGGSSGLGSIGSTAQGNGQLGPVGIPALGSFSQFMGAISDITSRAASTAGNAITGAGNAIGNALGGDSNPVGSGIKQLGQAVGGAAQQVASMMAQFKYQFYFNDRKSVGQTESQKSGNCKDLTDVARSEFAKRGIQTRLIHGKTGSGTGHYWIEFKDPKTGQWTFFDPTAAATSHSGNRAFQGLRSGNVGGRVENLQIQ